MIILQAPMKRTIEIASFSPRVLAATPALSSCGTSRRTIRLPAEPIVTVEQAGVTMTLRFLDEPSLRQRFGSTENPFLTDYYRVDVPAQRGFRADDPRTRDPRAFPFELRDCELQYGGKTLGPLNRFQLASDVDILEEDPRQKAPKKALINRYVLPNRAKSRPWRHAAGFLLFQGNLPISGEALVTIPGKGGGSFLSIPVRLLGPPRPAPIGYCSSGPSPVQPGLCRYLP